MPLNEIPKAHASIVALCPIRPSIFIFIYFDHIGAALFGRKWHEDPATQNEGTTKVLTNTAAFLVKEVFR